MSNQKIAIENDGVNLSDEQREKLKWLSAAFLIILIALGLIFFSPWASEPRGVVEISEGRGLQQHVSFAEAIDLAEQNGLPISATPLGEASYQVSYTEARNLESEIAGIKIDVLVYAGDRFDLDTGEYIPGPMARQMGR